MSKQDTQSLKSNSISLNQNYAEFIQQFKEKHNLIKPIPSFEKNRWEYLYNQSKLNKIKKEEFIKKQLNLRNIEFNSQCTFHPQLYNSKYYKTENSLQTNKDVTKSNEGLNGSLTLRHQTWAFKREMHIEQIKENKKLKELEECLFQPEINAKRIKNEVNLTTSATKIVEDPESFSLYVDRLKNKRKCEAKIRKRQKSLPGSGNIWTAKPKKYNLNYDYRKHEYSSRGLKNINKKIYSLSRPLTPSKFTTTTKQNGKKILKEDKDKFYEILYKRDEKDKNDLTKAKDEQRLNTKAIKGNKMMMFDKEIEFGKALEILHNQLHSFKLMKEE